MFTVYLDESGTHEQSQAFVLGGYVAADEQWCELAREWQELLNDEAVDLMHMTDLENLRGRFQGWDKARQLRVIQKIHGIIHRRLRIGVSSGVLKAHYDQIQERLGPVYGRNYYTLCAMDCIKHISNWAHENKHYEEINFVFEQGGLGLRGLADILENEKRQEREANDKVRIGEVRVEDKRAVIQLQASDVVAYETWKQMQNRIVAGELRPMRRSLWSLLRRSKGTPHVSNYFNQDNLRELANVVAARNAARDAG